MKKRIKKKLVLRLVSILVLFFIISNGIIFYFYRNNSYRVVFEECKNFTFLSSRFIIESYRNNYKKSFLRFLEDIAKIVKLNPNLEKVELIDISGIVIFDSEDILKKYLEKVNRAKKIITDRKILNYTRGIKPVYLYKGEKLIVYFPYVEEYGNHFYTFRYTFSTKGIYNSLYELLAILFVFYILSGVVIFYIENGLFSKLFNGISILNKSIEDLSKGKYTYIKDENEFFAKVYGNFNILLENYKFILDDKEKTISTLNEMLFKCEEDKKSYEEEIRKKNRILKDVIEDAKNARRERVNFLAKISHELRTPLNSILGFSGILLQGVRGELDEEVKKDIFSIYRNSQFLLKVIDDIMNLSKIEMNKFELDIKKIDIKTLLENVYNDFKPLVEEKGLQFDLLVEDDILYVFGDEHKIKEVLNNLLDNSIKFTESGYIKVRAFRNMDNKDLIVISVEDTGIGIREEDIKKIFEEFYQVEGKKGAGLGLSISKKFVEIMGGDLWVESKFGRGSTFYFTLPIAK